MHLECISYSCSYDSSSPIIDTFSYHFTTGKIYAIVGGSGTGKSTLLHAIAGIHSSFVSQKGEILRDGHDILSDHLYVSEQKKHGRIGYMLQQPTLLPHLNIKENIEFPVRMTHNHTAKEGSDTIDRLLQTIGLTHVQDYLPHRLSGGMQTRVALARTYSTQPRLILLDEPFSSLDIGRKTKLYDDLLQLTLSKRKSKKPTVILVTHDVQEALYLTNNILIRTPDHTRTPYHVNASWPRKSYHNTITQLHQDTIAINNILIGQ